MESQLTAKRKLLNLTRLLEEFANLKEEPSKCEKFNVARVDENVFCGADNSVFIN